MPRNGSTKPRHARYFEPYWEGSYHCLKCNKPHAKSTNIYDKHWEFRQKEATP